MNYLSGWIIGPPHVSNPPHAGLYQVNSQNRSIEIIENAMPFPRKYSNETCSICLSDIIDKENTENTTGKIVLTNCNHIFHYDCIKTSIDSGNKTCPMCRITIRSLRVLIKPIRKPRKRNGGKISHRNTRNRRYRTSRRSTRKN